MVTSAALAQTATNACGYNAGNEYPVGASCVYTVFDKPGSFTATYTATGCTGGNYDDAWGWFTATEAITNITFNPDDNHRPIMHIYTGACGSLTQVTCVNSGGNGNNAVITDLVTTPGQTYMIRIQRHNDNGGMDGRLCIWSPSPPTNDDPCGAVALTVGMSCSNTAATNVLATASAGIPAPGCGNYTGGDVWFSFVAPANGTVIFRTSTNGLTDSGVALYSANTCSTGYTLITCSANGNGNMGQFTQGGLTPGTTYYARVWGENGASGTFNACVWSPVTNDEPCTAISLNLGSTCDMLSYHNVGATASAGIPAPGCSNYSGGDVWFSFVAPANGLVTIRTTAGTLTNAAMALYSASACNGTFNLISCDNLSGPNNMPFLSYTPLELVAGNTYYLRVWGNSGNTGSFNLCANTAPAVGDCAYVLHMYDSGGDGWGSSNVSIQVGAGAPVSYQVSTGDRETAYISASIGDVIQLTYNAVGGGQGEIRYVLQLMYGTVYQDGPTPGTGLRYAGVANCQSAPPTTSDCYGRTAICNAQQINDNPTTTGLTTDLHLHNRGCLGSNERQGSWYSFSPSASGTVAFTISPTNPSDDYDFAVWGPFGSLSCPPLVTPYRCNYSATTGDTGLSTSASNPSEGAGGSKWSTAMVVTAGEYYLLYISNWTQSGLAFNLTWQLTNGASLDCALLPIELVSLYGAPVPEGIRLDWVTATESNSDHFAIERMNEEGGFDQIGHVAASGWSASATAYQFLDPQPMPGFNHYRIKMVDQDGTTKVSDVVSVANRYGAMHTVPYPNPATNEIYVEVEMDEDASIQTGILDASGRLVRQHAIAVRAGSQRLRIPIDGLDAGAYTLTFLSAQGTAWLTGRFFVE
ncbi:MAG: T9SS type A sorting domain-containing protein [Flavobacteriales bacterium]|nr:T9SS type A sorting domain-containing protein [Flavobacteriales bacterium]